jgi:hypothetical protein
VRHVPDGAIVTDHRRQDLCVVHDGAVLDGGARADDDAGAIAAQTAPGQIVDSAPMVTLPITTASG